MKKFLKIFFNLRAWKWIGTVIGLIVIKVAIVFSALSAFTVLTNWNDIRDIRSGETAQMQNTVRVLQESLQANNVTMGRLHDTNTSLSTQVTVLQAEIDLLQSTMGNSGTNVSETASLIAQMTAQLQSLHSAINNNNSAITNLQNTNAGLNDQITNLANTVANRDALIASLNGQILELRGDISALEIIITNKQAQADASAQVISILNRDLSDLNDTIASQNQELQALLNLIRDLENQLYQGSGNPQAPLMNATLLFDIGGFGLGVMTIQSGQMTSFYVSEMGDIVQGFGASIEVWGDLSFWQMDGEIGGEGFQIEGSMMNVYLYTFGDALQAVLGGVWNGRVAGSVMFR